MRNPEGLSVPDYYQHDSKADPRMPNLIVFVCSESQGQSCPIIPYKTDKIYWNIKDPSALLGTSSALAKEIDSIRNQIKSKVLELIHNKM